MQPRKRGGGRGGGKERDEEITTQDLRAEFEDM